MPGCKRLNQKEYDFLKGFFEQEYKILRDKDEFRRAPRERERRPQQLRSLAEVAHAAERVERTSRPARESAPTAIVDSIEADQEWLEREWVTGRWQ
eukprot:6205517-Pleurochrysis_carterae.AAC.1